MTNHSHAKSLTPPWVSGLATNLLRVVDPRRRLCSTQRFHLLLTLLVWGYAHHAHALQTLEVRDGVSVEAMISIQEPTRIRIEQAAITDVYGNIYSSNCGNATASPPINPQGEVVLECDRDKGEIYLRPMGQGNKPINLFIASEYATYTLILRRTDIPAETIVLRDPQALRAKTAANRQTSSTTSSGLMLRQQYLSNLKSLVRELTSSPLSEAKRRANHAPLEIALWQEVRLTRLRVAQHANLLGEHYRLQNISANPITLNEMEFDRPDAKVAAIAIEHHNLRPGDSTSVYVVLHEVQP